MKHLPIAALVATALWAIPAHAITFKDASQKTFRFNPDLRSLSIDIFGDDPVAPSVRTTIGLNGELTLGRRSGPINPVEPEGDLTIDPLALISPLDILDFEIFLDAPLVAGGPSTRIRATPSNAAFDVIFGTLKTDGQNIMIDSSAPEAQLGILQLTVDTPPPAGGFPAGKRFGDDTTSLVAFFRGSVGLGYGVLPEGFLGTAPPTALGSALLTSGDDFVLASAGTATVPLPASALLLAGAIGGLALRSRGWKASR